MTDEDTPRYQLDTRIATGGMGEVWRATDRVLGRQVAVKVLKTEYADDPTFRSRFETEARNAAALHHPNVASVFDFGELPGEGHPQPYLVMELVPGEPLSALLRGGERMPAETAADLVAQAADAVEAAHALGIVHRDMKPANLLVTPDGTVKITDFGIARAADAVALTQTGQVIGTPQYLSPEQAEGKPATRASDIYSLGVVLYECLAGHRPFDGDSPIVTALAHLRDDPPPLPDDVPAALREAVSVALAKDPDARFATAADFARALRGGPVHAAEAPTVVAGAAPAAAGMMAAAAARSGDDGTRVLTQPRPAAATTRPDRRRMPAWLPWAAAALGVLVIVIALATLGRGDDVNPDDNQAADSPSASTSEQPSEPATSKSPPPDDRVRVVAADYIGRSKDEAKKDLEELGFKVEEQMVENPDGQEKDTVADVTPSGLVEPDETITLSIWDSPPEEPESEEPQSKGNGAEKGKKEKDD